MYLIQKKFWFSSYLTVKWTVKLHLGLLTALSFYGVLGKPPSLYEYYTVGGIHSGLDANGTDFHLNGKPFVIYSGSMHYFRNDPEYWALHLARLKVAGLNAVQFYVPWNMHEDTPGNFDFASPQLNLTHFLQLIKAADMFAIVRPGPYICAEWEFGGLPSWLLRDPNMRLRSLYPPFIDRVKIYYNEVYRIINQFQFSVNGGPVIMAQIENEYFGAYLEHDLQYLKALQKIVRDTGFKELLFASDGGDIAQTNPIKDVSDLFETANLNQNASQVLTELRKTQPNRPVYVSEFWPGWFDQWGADEKHNRYSLDEFDRQVSDILFRVNGSINFYMFIGGTNFGFMNGGFDKSKQTHAHVVTSYDYDAPLTESGNYTDKFYETRNFYDQLVTLGRMPELSLPDQPPLELPTRGYGKIPVQDWLPLETILNQTTKFINQPKPISMEMLDLGPGYGQRYGFVLYRIEAGPISQFEINGPINDRALFMVDGTTMAIIEDGSRNFSINIKSTKHLHANNLLGVRTNTGDAIHRYDVLVENQGRLNWAYSMESQRKGIQSDILLNGQVWHNHSIYCLDWNSTFLQQLNTFAQWQTYKQNQLWWNSPPAPALYRAVLKIDGQVADTYLYLPGWTKGQVFVNERNLGRYWAVGPQMTLYLPAPWLRSGTNTILIFELHQAGHMIAFVDYPILNHNATNDSGKAKQIFNFNHKQNHRYMLPIFGPSTS